MHKHIQIVQPKEKSMEIVLKELFGSSIGLLSLFTISFVIAMGFWFSWWYKRNINQDK